MKKYNYLFVTSLLLILVSSIGSVSCNMAAPKPNDFATSITFEKNNDISVSSEHLTIEIDDQIAHINAAYTMKNTKDEIITTPSMFISPNIENLSTKVKFNDSDLDYVKETYYATYNSELSENNWEFIILDTKEETNDYFDLSLDTIKFDLMFNPNEEAVINVAYDYRLGGRPDRNDHYKYAELDYYIKPIGLWKDFDNLTIDLYLDDNLPVLKQSNYEFNKLKDNHYQCVINELPKEDLHIKVDQTGFQEFIASFRSPYILPTILMYLPFILIFIALGVTLFFIIRHNIRKRKTNGV